MPGREHLYKAGVERQAVFTETDGLSEKNIEQLQVWSQHAYYQSSE